MPKIATLDPADPTKSTNFVGVQDTDTPVKLEFTPDMASNLADLGPALASAEAAATTAVDSAAAATAAAAALTAALGASAPRMIGFGGSHGDAGPYQMVHDHKGRLAQHALFIPVTYFTKANGVLNSSAAGGAASAELPTHAKFVYDPSVYTFFYLDLRDGLYHSVATAGGDIALPAAMLDKIVPLGTTVGSSFLSPYTYMNAENVERSRILWTGDMVIDGAAVNIPPYYYLGDGATSYVLIAPYPAAAYAIPQAFFEVTVTPSTPTTIWHDHLAYQAAQALAAGGDNSGLIAAGWIKKATNGAAPQQPTFYGAPLVYCLNGAYETTARVVGDVPGGSEPNQCAYYRDLSLAPSARLFNTTTWVPVTDATLNGILITGGWTDTVNNRPYAGMNLPDPRGRGQGFFRFYVEAYADNDFGTPHVAFWSASGSRGNVAAQLEHQYSTRLAMFSVPATMPPYDDLLYILAGTDPSGAPGGNYVISGLQFHSSGRPAWWVRRADAPVVPTNEERIAALEADVLPAFGSASALNLGRPKAVAVSTNDFLLIGDSLLSDGQGCANEFAALYPGRQTQKEAIPGQTSAEMALRMGGGGGTCQVAGGVIPSNAGVVLTNLFPDPFLGTPGDPCSFLAAVQDVPGVLSKTGGVVTFTRSVNGAPVPVPTIYGVQVATLRIRSTKSASTTAAGSVPQSTVLNRTIGVRAGHNDIFFGPLLQGIRGYSRSAVKQNILSIVGSGTAAAGRVWIMPITPGYKWLTTARIAGLGASGTVGAGASISDANTIAASIEAQALNAWMADTFAGYVDLVTAYANAGHITNIDFGGGNVLPFLDTVFAPDGIHDVDGGPRQVLDAQTAKATLDTLGW